MAKKSAAALSIVKALPIGELPEPPDGLTKEEADLWRGIVETKPADWFSADSRPLLLEYVRSIIMCDVLDGRVKRLLDADAPMHNVKYVLDMRDKESKRLANLATKLRLTQQSRYPARTADRVDRKANGARPWES